MSHSLPDFRPLEGSQQLLLAHYNQVEQQVALAVASAALIVSANALLLSGYVTVAKDWQVFETPASSIPAVAFAIAGGLLVIGLLCSLWAALPSVRFYVHGLPITDLFFFGRVGTYQTFPEYLEAFTRVESAGQIDRELLFQIWGKSRFPCGIFRRLYVAIVATMSGTIVGVVVLVFLALH